MDDVGVRASPILPVTDLGRALAHHAALGFLVSEHDVAARWAAVPGTNPPVDQPWGVREGAHVDPDGNLLRFGSPLPSAR